MGSLQDRREGERVCGVLLLCVVGCSSVVVVAVVVDETLSTVIKFLSTTLFSKHVHYTASICD